MKDGGEGWLPSDQKSVNISNNIEKNKERKEKIENKKAGKMKVEKWSVFDTFQKVRAKV